MNKLIFSCTCGNFISLICRVKSMIGTNKCCCEDTEVHHPIKSISHKISLVVSIYVYMYNNIIDDWDKVLICVFCSSKPLTQIFIQLTSCNGKAALNVPSSTSRLTPTLIKEKIVKKNP